MGAPEVSVPSTVSLENSTLGTVNLIADLVGELEYRSRVTDLDEQLPVVVSVLGKPGAVCFSTSLYAGY